LGHHGEQHADPQPHHELLADVRRQAFERAASNYDRTFRSELYRNEQPRQGLFYTIGILFLVAFTYARQYSIITLAPAPTAILGLGGFYLIYCILNVKDSSFHHLLFPVGEVIIGVVCCAGLNVRPHPAVWRVAHGISVLYMLCLCALFVLSLDEGRQLVRDLLPNVRPASESITLLISILVLQCIFW
jgi:hypothetical protein